jgi:hypothetical protein
MKWIWRWLSKKRKWRQTTLDEYGFEFGGEEE